ncbi:hypothetical protein H4582DRAFT_1771712, partial [Lactarius indigo]
LDTNIEKELGAFEQCKFKVLSEAEPTAALYSLLRHSAQSSDHFFTFVLRQMARADPMTVLLN